MVDYSSGIGDPYWYEWTVGLIQIIEMLNPDSKISSVTLQGQNIQGWDDVIVEYTMRRFDYYQIKHTRVDDTITYGDLVTETKEKSLLSYLASCWKSIPYNKDSKFILYTNRKIGNRKSKVKINHSKIVRPGLKSFFEEIKINCKQHDNTNLFTISNEFEDSYNQEWLNQLYNLNNKEKVLFLKQLEFRTGQSELNVIEEQLLNNIASYLTIERNKALSILSSLDNALRIWATTYRRKKEKITQEDVYEKLRIPAYEYIGDHNLLPPYPFFSSRETVVNSILSSIKDTNKSIIFLTGPPGVGKTSLISKLANKINPPIHLRYYTFKPISPENDLLPADAGRTINSFSLWSDLLSQLRDYFKGNIAKYKIPIRNDFITDVDILRAEVLRLASELSLQNNTKTVICIDGIDHAARAELETTDNYLNSLIPPDNVPNNILFLISGQPPEFYEKYPSWLKEENDKICKIEIPNLNIDDIKLLLSNDIEIEKDLAAQLIFDHTNGNTLSVLYALHTFNKFSTIEDAKSNFETYKLRNGLNIYYENIWEHSVSSLTNINYLAIKIACVFSLTAAKLSAINFHKLIPEINVENWEIVLNRLSPMIIKQDNGYNVLHNDVKVFFTKIVKNASENIFKKTSLDLLNLYLEEDTFVNQRHIELIRLLDKSGSSEKIIEILSPKFILEAYINECPSKDIEEQILYALKVAIKQKSIKNLHLVTCCIKSFIQLHNSLSEIEKTWNFINIEQKFLNELRVLKKENWTLVIIHKLFEEILFLFRHNQENRAHGLIERWLTKIDYDKFLSIFSNNEISTKSILHQNEEEVSPELKELLENYGRIKQYYYKGIFHFNSKDDFHKESIASISTGFFSEAKLLNDKLNWYRTINYMPKFIYPADIDKTLFWLFSNQKWIEIYLLLKRVNQKDLSDPYKLLGIVSALFSKNKKLIDSWYNKFSNKLIDLSLNQEHLSENYYYEYLWYSVVCFIQGWKNLSKDVTEIVSLVSRYTIKKGRNNQETSATKQLFRYSALLGRLFFEVYEKRKIDNFIFIKFSEIIEILQKLLSFQKDNFNAHIHTDNTTKFLFSSLLFCTNSCKVKHQNQISNILVNYYNDEFVYSTHYEIIWDYLYKRGFTTKCKTMLNNIIGENGQIWTWQSFERYEVINILSKLTINTEFKELVNKSKDKLRWFSIGFNSNKDYNLYDEITWLEEILKKTPNSWMELGSEILPVSFTVDELADNRASNSLSKLLLFAAIKSSPTDTLILYNELRKNHTYCRETIVNAVIEYFDYYKINKDKIKLIWLFTCGYMYWSQYSDRKILFKLKNKLQNLEISKDNTEIKSFVENSNPIEFNIEKLSNIDENKISVKNFNLADSAEKLIEEFLRSSKQDIDHLVSVIQILEKERPTNYRILLNKIVKITFEYENQSYWRYNGLQRIYEQLIPLITNSEKWKIAHNILQSFLNTDRYKSFQSLGETFDYFCLYFCIENLVLLKDGFHRLLDLHKDWLTGFSNYNDLPINKIKFKKTSNIKINTWYEFAIRILLEKIDSNSAIQVEFALQAIWQIIKINPLLIIFFDRYWHKFSDDQKEYLLMLFELIPIYIPKNFKLLKPILNKAYNSNLLAHKLQAFLVYNTHSILNKQKVKIPKFKTNTKLSIHKVVISPFTKVFKIEKSKKNYHNYISNYHQLFDRRINFLETASGMNLEDYIVNKLSYLISSVRLRQNTLKKSDLSQDFIIHSRDSGDLFNSIVEHMLAKDMFEVVPLIRIAQALLSNDDPHTFEIKYIPHFDLDLWPSKLDNDFNPDQSMNKILNFDISENKILLGGEIRLFDYKKAFIGFLNSYFLSPSHLVPSYKNASTYNSRSSFIYDEKSYNQISSDRPFFIKSGGISKLLHSQMWLFPSKELFDFFGWKLSLNNPTHIVYKGKVVAKLEKYIGKIESMDSHHDRHSAVQRWVGDKLIFQEVTSSITKYTIKQHLRNESINFKE